MPEVGPMVTRAGQSLDALGVRYPDWRSAADVTSERSSHRIKRSALLSVGDLANKVEVKQKKPAAWIFDQARPRGTRAARPPPDHPRGARPLATVGQPPPSPPQFALPVPERKHLLNCIHPIASADTVAAGPSGAAAGPLGALPAEVKDADLSRRWWSSSPPFGLFSMAGTSMSYAEIHTRYVYT